MIRNALAFALAAAIALPAGADDWPQFGRDASRNGVSPEKDPPTWWQLPERDKAGKLVKPARNVRWTAKVSGLGYSHVCGDPVVSGGLVWVGGNEHLDLGDEKPCDPRRTTLVCLDETTGKELYRRVMPLNGEFELDGRSHAHGSSPCVEGDTLWVLTNRAEVLCLDIGPLKRRTGPPRERWVLDTKKELGVRPAAALFPHRRSSPAAYKDWVYVGTGNGRTLEGTGAVADAPSFLCLEKTTGKVVWADSTPGRNVIRLQTASPTVIEAGGRAQVVVPQGDGWVRAFDPPTGKVLWEFDTNPHDAVPEYEDLNNPRNDILAAAVFHGGKLYIGNGWESERSDPPGWLYCIDPTRTGDISPLFTRGPNKGKANLNSGMVWKYGGVDRSVPKDKWGCHPVIFGRTITNVAVADGLVIACDAGGTVHCLDAATGRVCWTLRERRSGCIYGSPLVVGGRVYVTRSGTGVLVFELSRVKPRVTVVGDLYSECSPVFANGTLYLADNKRMYAIAEVRAQVRP